MSLNHKIGLLLFLAFLFPAVTDAQVTGGTGGGPGVPPPPPFVDSVTVKAKTDVRDNQGIAQPPHDSDEYDETDTDKALVPLGWEYRESIPIDGLDSQVTLAAPWGSREMSAGVEKAEAVLLFPLLNTDIIFQTKQRSNLGDQGTVGDFQGCAESTTICRCISHPLASRLTHELEIRGSSWNALIEPHASFEIKFDHTVVRAGEVKFLVVNGVPVIKVYAMDFPSMTTHVLTVVNHKVTLPPIPVPQLTKVQFDSTCRVHRAAPAPPAAQGRSLTFNNELKLELTE